MSRAFAATAAFLVLLAAVAPASARILKTRRPGEYKELTLTIGSGFEMESDGEQTEYAFPLLVEYGVTERLTLTAEPAFGMVPLEESDKSASGFGELETSVTYEFLTERRHRPSIAAQGVVKWPTASRPELGTGEIDYSIGAVVSKEFVAVDLDLEGLYTFVGQPPGSSLENTLEGSLAVEWRAFRAVDLLGEFVASTGAVSSRGPGGAIGGFGGGPTTGESSESEFQGTLGLAQHIGKHLKIEQGFLVSSGGSWQVLAAWEWDFSGGR